MAKRRSKGDGSIYFDEKRGLYIGQITLGYDDRGKRKRKTVYGSTKTEVKNKLKNVEYQVYTGTFVDKSEITIYHLTKQILDDRLNQNEIKPSTYYRHLQTLKELHPLSGYSVQDTNEAQIKAFFGARLHYSQSVIKKMFEMLNRSFSEAVRLKIIKENPMAYMKKPNSKKQTVKVRALTKQEQKKLIEILLTEDINYSQQMLLSLATGMRMGEVNALSVEDVNFAFNKITVKRTISRGEKGEAVLSDTTKTYAGQRVLTMTEEVCHLMKECIGDKKSGLIFLQNDKMITTTQVNSQFSRLLKKYSVLDETVTDGKIDLHSLRHTFGTRCAEAGMPPKVLQEIMGHTDISVTMNTYFYATTDYVQDNILRVNTLLKEEGLSISYQSENFTGNQTDFSAS